MVTHATDSTIPRNEVVPLRRAPGIILLIAALYAGILQPAAAGDARYSMDISDAEVSFSVRVLGLITVTGRFAQVEGGLIFSDSCATSGITFRIRTDSVSTANRSIDSIIRGPSLLNSAQYPVITFNSSQIAGDIDSPGTITGELTLNGIRRSISFTIVSGQPGPGDHEQSLPYHAHSDIRRSDFGIAAPLPGTSDRIRIQVSVTVRRSELMMVQADSTDMAL